MLRRPLGNTGLTVSRLGFGAASLGEEYGTIDPAAALRVVPHALDAGIDLLDTSPYYGRGRSEVMLGFALRGIARDRFRICTKLGRYDDRVFDFSPARVRESVDVSLKRLGVEHLDIVLCHDVEFVDPEVVVEDAIPTLRALQRSGKVGAVGISGYPMKVFREVLARTDLDLILSYGNLTLHNRALEALLPLCADRGVGVIDAAPFDMRLLTEAEPPDWHPAPPDLRRAVAAARDLCRARGQSLARLAFQFALQHEGPATTIVGTAYPTEVDQWLRWLDEPLDRDLLREVETLLAPVRDRPRRVGLPANND
jgi:aryl-alcohol dehydrogenase-like predicted oxidoreductase